MTLALSIRQPWCWAILHAGKDVENRDWSTRVRGRVLIHAAKGMTQDEWADCFDVCRLASRLGKNEITQRFPSHKKLERGGIVGSVEIVDCVERSESPWFFGRYGFVLRDPQPLLFLPCKGRLGFFEVDEATLYQEARP
jgi:hypothetical protein